MKATGRFIVCSSALCEAWVVEISFCTSMIIGIVQFFWKLVFPVVLSNISSVHDIKLCRNGETTGINTGETVSVGSWAEQTWKGVSQRRLIRYHLNVLKVSLNDQLKTMKASTVHRLGYIASTTHWHQFQVQEGSLILDDMSRDAGVITVIILVLVFGNETPAGELAGESSVTVLRVLRSGWVSISTASYDNDSEVPLSVALT